MKNLKMNPQIRFDHLDKCDELIGQAINHFEEQTKKIQNLGKILEEKLKPLKEIEIYQIDTYRISKQVSSIKIGDIHKNPFLKN
ncbi:hypothetical protein [Mongoliibacter sp.]|uniref:hypothetical protein n=1 Tax=Mongoliibacter sp. TaxID=2022438 RepID=UPI0025E50016|nr:hypothetical protein [Mongoliibacter sp.]